MKLAFRAAKPLCAEGLVEPVGRIRRLAEEEHRRDATLKKPTRHIAQQKPAEAPTMKTTQHVNLIQFAHESRHPAIVRCALRKADQLACVILDDKAKPASVLYLECFAPLALPKFIRRPPTAPATMRFAPRWSMSRAARTSWSVLC